MKCKFCKVKTNNKNGYCDECKYIVFLGRKDK